MSGDRRELAAVFVGGVIGTLCRASVAELLPSDAGTWPWATFWVNVAGAFVLGAFATRLTGAGASHRRALLSTGFCGALTTFSTMQLELLELLDDGRVALAAAYAGVSVAAGFLAIAAAKALVRRTVAPA